MANTYKNGKQAAVGVTLTDVYTTPAATSSIVVGLCISNILAENVFANVKVYDNSGADSVYLVKDAPIPIGGSLVVVGGDQKLVLEASDKIQVQSDTAAALDVFVSVLEVT